MARPKKFHDEVMERPIAHVAHAFGMHPETLRKKVRQAEADTQTDPK